MNNQSDKRFKIALSFPGEHRDFVKQVADVLSQSVGRVRVLYDHYHEAEFAQPDLNIDLPISTAKTRNSLQYSFAKNTSRSAGANWNGVRFDRWLQQPNQSALCFSVSTTSALFPTSA